MTTFKNIPVAAGTKCRVHDLRYEMRVDTYDEVVAELVEAYQRHEQEESR